MYNFLELSPYAVPGCIDRLGPTLHPVLSSFGFLADVVFRNAFVHTGTRDYQYPSYHPAPIGDARGRAVLVAGTVAVP